MKKEIAVLGLLFSSSAMAQYQLELNAGVAHVESQTNVPGFGRYNEAYENSDVVATYYFSPVAIDNVALSDAAFLARSSWVRLNLQESNFNVVDVSSVLVEGHWVTSRGTAFSVTYNEWERVTANEAEERHGPGVRLGQYIGDSSMVGLRYQNQKYEYRDESGLYNESISDREIYSLLYKNVVMSNNRATADIEVELEKSNEQVQLRSKLGWYYGNNTKYGVTAGIVDFDSSRPSRRLYSIWGEWFALQNLAVNVDYQISKMQVPRGGADFHFQEDSVRLGLTYRL